MDRLSKFSIRDFAFMICGIGFTIGAIISIYKNPELLQNIKILPSTFIIFLGVPLTILLNSYEYILMGKLLNKNISLINSIEICILASAANMLPIPGGALTRIGGLKRRGATYLHATTTNFLFAIIWLAIAFLVSGAGLMYFSQKFYGWTFLLTGITLLTLSVSKMFIQGASFPIVILSIFQRIALIAVDALRLWGCLIALGVDAKVSQTTIFAVGGVLGSAVSIVPAGLGVREGISAGLAPLVGLGAAAGFLAAALNRLLGLSFLVPTAFLLLKFQKAKYKHYKY